MSVIRFDGVSKQFTLHRQRPRSFQELFLTLFRPRRPAAKEKYWALRDVSFEIGAGETIGLIGDNGAGKSTALKLMSRIIEPTSGRIEIQGRVGALLELGAGFHPDLTGRENIYLNGSILGFSRTKMNRIFDDIVDFSEMERFIDVPVKHYSSGMYMRLAFSIAIHLDPDILLVDEVLAVGDQAFQLRCLDKINEMKRQGVTIVLVTHALDQVRELCDRAIWLKDGQIQAMGEVERVLEQYLAEVLAQDREQILAEEEARAAESQGAEADDSAWRWGSREAEITHVQLLDAQGQERRTFQTGKPFTVRIHFVAKKRIENPKFGLAIYHNSGFQVNGPNTHFAGIEIGAIEGQGYLDYSISSLPLLEGTYLLSVAVDTIEGTYTYDFHHQAYTFRVRPNPRIREEFGSIYIPAVWEFGPQGFFHISSAGGEGP